MGSEIIHTARVEGIKHDTGKLRYDLLPPESVQEIVKVITFGAEKYGDRNWQLLSNFNSRYVAAAMRHIESYRMGNHIDSESGLYHLAHAATNLIFLIWGDLNYVEDNSNKP